MALANEGMKQKIKATINFMMSRYKTVV